MSHYDQMTKDELGELYWDVYKEVHGIRPRWLNHDDVTAEWYKAALDLLAEEADLKAADEAVMEAKAIAALEERITSLIEMGAGDRANAIRWLHDAMGTNGDDEYLCYTLCIPYGYFNKKADI